MKSVNNLKVEVVEINIPLENESSIKEEFLKTIDGTECIIVCFDSADKTTLEAVDTSAMAWMLEAKSSVPVVLLGTNIKLRTKLLIDNKKTNLVQKSKSQFLKLYNDKS